jgi:hypothetical protein
MDVEDKRATQTSELEIQDTVLLINIYTPIKIINFLILYLLKTAEVTQTTQVPDIHESSTTFKVQSTKII